MFKSGRVARKNLGAAWIVADFLSQKRFISMGT
jgi:hypothetical protein